MQMYVSEKIILRPRVANVVIFYIHSFVSSFSEIDENLQIRSLRL